MKKTKKQLQSMEQFREPLHLYKFCLPDFT